MISSTQHFISCLTFKVYGSWKSWITIMNALSVIDFNASGRSIPHVAHSSCSAVISVPGTADALHSFSSAPRTDMSGMTRLLT